MKKGLFLFAALLAIGGGTCVWQTVGAARPALPLRLVGDFPLTGNPTRFNYASMDAPRGLLWPAHMGDGSVEAFDVRTNRVTLTVPIAPDARVRGILAARGNVGSTSRYRTSAAHPSCA